MRRSSAKKQKVQAPPSSGKSASGGKSALAMTDETGGLCLVRNRPFPTAVESATFTFLNVDELGELAFLSKGLYGSVCRWFAAATSISFSGEFRTCSLLWQQPLLRHAGFATRLCRRLRTVSAPQDDACRSAGFTREYPWQFCDYLLPALIRANAATLEEVLLEERDADDSASCFASERIAEAASGCPNLRRLTMWYDRRKSLRAAERAAKDFKLPLSLVPTACVACLS